jgi:hypothetical protein
MKKLRGITHIYARTVGMHSRTVELSKIAYI